jgi:hypothetical protein
MAKLKNNRGDTVEVFDRGTSLRPIRLISARKDKRENFYVNVGLSANQAREVAGALLAGADVVEAREGIRKAESKAYAVLVTELSRIAEGR